MMTNFKYLLVLLFLCVGVRSAHPHIINNLDEEVSAIFDYVDETVKNLTSRLTEERKVVMVLGVTGSGKTVLTLHITGVELEAKKDPKSGLITIIHELASNPVSESETIVPNVMIDKEKHITYYDCGGFETAGLGHIKKEIAINYLLKKLWEHATQVKLLYTLHEGELLDNHKAFSRFAKHSSNIISNINHYKNGMGLVITKTTDDVGNNDVDLLEYRGNAVKNGIDRLRDADKNEEEKMKRFARIFLKHEHETKYERIRIHRKVKVVKKLNDIPEMVAEKKSITELMESLTWVNKRDSDFGFSFSIPTKDAILQLNDKFANTLEYDESKIGDEIKQFYIKQQSEAITVQQKLKLYKIVQSACEKLSQIPSKQNDLKLFGKELKNALTLRKIKGISMDNLKTHLDILNEFMKMNLFTLPNGFEIGGNLKVAMHELNDLNEKFKDSITNVSV